MLIYQIMIDAGIFWVVDKHTRSSKWIATVMFENQCSASLSLHRTKDSTYPIREHDIKYCIHVFTIRTSTSAHRPTTGWGAKQSPASYQELLVPRSSWAPGSSGAVERPPTCAVSTRSMWNRALSCYASQMLDSTEPALCSCCSVQGVRLGRDSVDETQPRLVPRCIDTFPAFCFNRLLTAHIAAQRRIRTLPKATRRPAAGRLVAVTAGGSDRRKTRSRRPP
jgi:hypothetical protein